MGCCHRRFCYLTPGGRLRLLFGAWEEVVFFFFYYHLCSLQVYIKETYVLVHCCWTVKPTYDKKECTSPTSHTKIIPCGETTELSVKSCKERFAQFVTKPAVNDPQLLPPTTDSSIYIFVLAVCGKHLEWLQNVISCSCTSSDCVLQVSLKSGIQLLITIFAGV